MNVRSVCRVIVLPALLLFSKSESFAQDAIAHAGQQLINRIYRGFQQPSYDGSFDFTITEIVHCFEIGYLNVAIDLNGDSTIDSYSIMGGGTQNEWIIRNIPISMTTEIFSEPTISVWFDFSDNIPIPSTADYAMIITEQPVSITMPIQIEKLSTWDRSTADIVGADWGTLDTMGQNLIEFAPVTPPTIGAGPVMLENPGPGDSLGVPDIAQKLNECGPTSAANSLIWLAKKNKFTDKLPKKQDGSLDTNQVILDLMKAMTGSNARPFGGIQENQLFTGKEQYIQNKSLPLSVEGGKLDTNARGAKTYDFMVKQLTKGQDVELLILWPGGGGHCVTVTGYAIALGRAFVFVHDPDDKKTAKVVWEFAVDGTGRVTGDITAPRACKAAWAVAESPSPDVGIEALPSLPKGFALYDNYPNPFNPSTIISFDLPTRSFISLKVFDLIGRDVATIVSEELPEGKYTQQWNAAGFPSGVYFYRLSAYPLESRDRQAGKFTETKKLILLR